jgi:hypothetical protein
MSLKANVAVPNPLLPWALVLLAVMNFASMGGNRAYGDEAAIVAVRHASTAAATTTKPEHKLPEWNTVIEGAKQIDGLFPLYYNEKEEKLFMAIRKHQLEEELILPISIARGAGMMFLGGDTLNFGNQWIISFRRVADRILVVRRNVKFKADAGSPQADAVKVSYNDSIIASLPVKSEQNDQALIDLGDLFMTDLADIGVQPDQSRSTWAKVKAFPENLEIEVAAVFNMGSRGFFSRFFDDSVADPRGAQVVIHYGLSKVPSSSYHSRNADDRVGHFLSTVRDFSKDIHDTPSVRYVTRWDLEKADASAKMSPPKKPIVFWIEKTVPREYRPYVRAGILEWNKAFAKLGFVDAIEVRDQTDLDDFDPEDIRFNTFRWITTSYGFAMGPSRTNPKTGQILDADIIFDEGMIRYWRGEYLQVRGIPQAMNLLQHGQRQAFFNLYASLVPELADNKPVLNRLFAEYRTSLKNAGPGSATRPERPTRFQPEIGCQCCMMGAGMQRELGLMADVMAAQGTIDPGGKVPQEFIGQAIKEVVMHEVGHTLGLRHNFKASTFISLKDANNPEVTHKKGMTGSVMDYAPANLAPKGAKQGDYFSDTIGPYDYWAIEYAYKPISGDETAELQKIAAKSSAPDLIYGTDEDMYLNPDPRINAFDLGDPLEFAQYRVQLLKDLLDKLQDRVVAKGEGWQRARDSFSRLLGQVGSAAYLASRYIGGEYTTRAHRDEPSAKLPFDPIPLAKQRQAIKLLKREILSDRAFRFSPELLKRLAPQHFRDDDVFFFSNYDFNVYDRVLSIQRIVLSHFLSSRVLQGIQNAELHASKGQKVIQLPEVFDALTDSIWSELPVADKPSEKKPAADKPSADKSAPAEKKGEAAKPTKLAIAAMRRNLQREHVKKLSNLVLGPSNEFSGFFMMLFEDFDEPAPADARALARHHLKTIDGRIDVALKDKSALDAYSRAHLEQVHAQIEKVFASTLKMNEP